MLDAAVRRAIAPPLDRIALRLDGIGVRPGFLTATGFVTGIGAVAAAAATWWPLALVLWLANRAFDGLDGPVARQRGATDLGGFLDIVADFTIYGGFVVAVGYAVPSARLATLVLLSAYYVSGTAFLALSSILEKRGTSPESVLNGDGRSLRFVGGLAEGTETVIVYILICLLPAHAALISWIFAAMVFITAGQRIVTGVRALRQTPTK